MKKRNQQKTKTKSKARSKPKPRKPTRPVVNHQVKKSGSGIAATLGGMAGTALGGPIGGVLGTAAGTLFSHLTGLGSYEVNRNTLMTNSDGVPAFGNMESGSIIRHREFIMDIRGSTSFNLQSFRINPGIQGTFPWLSAVALNFQQYKLKGCVFAYRPTSGAAINGTNPALGVVIMATNYDSLDLNFANKQAMESSDYCTSCSPAAEMLHPIECDPRLNVLSILYVNDGSIPTGGDIRMYDLGNFQIATTGMPADDNIVGELWVTYEIELLKPFLPNPVGSNMKVAHLVSSPATSASSTDPLGTTGAVVRPGSTLLVLSPTTNSFVLPYVGTYLVVTLWSANTDLVSVAGGISVGSHMALNAYRIFGNNTQTGFSFFSSGQKEAVIVSIVHVTEAGTTAPNTVTLTGPVDFVSGECDVMISQLSSGLTAPESGDLRDTVLTQLKSLEDQMMRIKLQARSRDLDKPADDSKSDYSEYQEVCYAPPPKQKAVPNARRL